ncbi:MAG: hypothetical protein NT080_09800 [Spirochaetes bacterium]|nr:hypothetical protein [Spirochaetota bacterium]
MPHSSVRDAYREYLSRRRDELEDRSVEAELAFFKVMRNLVFGTNRSIFLTTTGKDREGVEKWAPGKPINRVNVRATISGFRPENPAESIVIDTFRDDRRLSMELVIDRSDALYPRELLAGVEDPLDSKAATSVIVQALLRSLARDYDASLSLSYFPGDADDAVRVDVKRRGCGDLAALFDLVPVPPGPPLGAFARMERRSVRHAVVVVVADERAFEFPGRGPFLERMRTFTLTNDVIYFALATDYERLFAASAGPVEVATPAGTISADSAERRAEAGRALRDLALESFVPLAAAGIHVCPVVAGSPGWADSIVGFFRNRLVLK